jgi:hypothetical protein
MSLRLFVLFLALLALSAQHRVLKTGRVAPAALSRVVDRPETLETNAVRVAAVRVAPAPVLERLPVISAFDHSSRSRSARRFVAGGVRVQRAPRVTHFHSKRRIPRMNTEEPPRS